MKQASHVKSVVPGYVLWLALALISAGNAPAYAQAASSAAKMPKGNMFLVPVLVYNKHLMGQGLSQEEEHCVVSDLGTFRNLGPREPYLPKDCDLSLIHGLTRKDFQILDHGVEQNIQSVTAESWGMTVRDNYGMHSELSLTPAGKWSTPDGGGTLAMASIDLAARFELPQLFGFNNGKLPRIFGLDSARPIYWLAYVPSRPDVSGCRKVKIKVDQPKVHLFAWNRSCTGQSASDPLAGSKFERYMRKKLDAKKRGKLRPMIQAGSFFGDDGRQRIDVAVALPWNRLRHDWVMDERKRWMIGISGFVYKAGGTLALHFSDLACCSSFSPTTSGTQPGQIGYPKILDITSIYTIPLRYETQLRLPPGKYLLKVVLSDDEKYGRSEIPFTVDRYDGKRLALSSVMLCKHFRDAHVATVETAAAHFAAQYTPLVSKDVQLTPTGDTRFNKKNHEPLIAYFEIYEPLLTAKPATVVVAHILIRDAKTGRIVDNYARVSAAPYEKSGSWIVPVAREIPYNKFPKGAYRLQVQVTDSAGRSTPWRTADFTIQ